MVLPSFLNLYIHIIPQKYDFLLLWVLIACINCITVKKKYLRSWSVAIHLNARDIALYNLS